MPTPENKRERAARLYLMAADAYSRDDANLAEALIAKANQYADQAVTQGRNAQQLQQPQDKKDHK